MKSANILEAWKKALDFVKKNGHSFTDNEGRECHEVDNFVMEVENVEDTKSALHWIRAQSDWYYPSDEELKQVLFTTTAQTDDRYAYGSRIFWYRGELNQLDGYVIPLLKKNPNSRRALVALVDPLADDVTLSRNFISFISLWFRIFDGKVCVTSTIRSNDLLLGWPANMYQISLLQEYVAKALDLQCGSITTISLSAHYFSDDAWLIDRLEN